MFQTNAQPHLISEPKVAHKRKPKQRPRGPIYVDRHLMCEDCSFPFVFSAREQRYWNEVLNFWTAYPKRCLKCRKKRRAYGRYTSELQKALETLEPDDPLKLANIAQLHLKMGHLEKALEYFRRAKNQTKDEATKSQLERQIRELLEYIDLAEILPTLRKMLESLLRT